MVTVGSSILVPSVQELAKEHMINVPPVMEAPSLLPSIPKIDMERLVLQESSAAELERLHSACKKWGFFQVFIIASMFFFFFFVDILDFQSFYS